MAQNLSGRGRLENDVESEDEWNWRGPRIQSQKTKLSKKDQEVSQMEKEEFQGCNSDVEVWQPSGDLSIRLRGRGNTLGAIGSETFVLKKRGLSTVLEFCTLYLGHNPPSLCIFSSNLSPDSLFNILHLCSNDWQARQMLPGPWFSQLPLLHPSADYENHRWCCVPQQGWQPRPRLSFSHQYPPPMLSLELLAHFCSLGIIATIT